MINSERSPGRVPPEVLSALTWWRRQVLPFVALPVLAWLWWRLVPDLGFVVYAMFLPALYGYLVPGVAIVVFRQWRFTGAGRSGLPWNHGLLWAVNLSSCLLPAFQICGGRPADVAAATGIILTTAGTIGFVYWVIDLSLAVQGLVEIDNPPARAGEGPAAMVSFYAPWCFPLVGAGYAAGCLIARATAPAGWMGWLGLYALGLGLMWLPATLVWAWRHGWLVRR